ncbi:cell division protein FtsX [Sphingobium subterraneum]|uniref:Cell division transport system permease protein n=1 Tax=Sphingobium subterraneum TaxID=627688 RepID=A0A841J8T5_9SPHN|nr:FtsX-like permease family protein [Sphingobium subterraneum]MBB6124925.1 cell division transport system permease protein [Sphingobium subterraneum]
MSRVDNPRRAAAAARNRLLPEGRVGGPMPWVIAIMMFLTILAAAAGLGLANGLWTLRGELAGRSTVQLVEADRVVRDALAQRIATRLRALPAVAAVDIVPQSALADQLRPWLGEAADGTDLPVPALIDISVRPEASAQAMAEIRTALNRIAPQTRIEAHAAYLAPVERLMRSLMWLAALLVALMLVATGAVVMLAARGAHAANRATIDILHLMGATDVQVARLFQRRTALDALFGGALGLVTAAGAIMLLGDRLAATGSELTGLVHLPGWAWVILPLIPVGAVLLAMLTARTTVRRALERSL